MSGAGDDTGDYLPNIDSLRDRNIDDLMLKRCIKIAHPRSGVPGPHSMLPWTRPFRDIPPLEGAGELIPSYTELPFAVHKGEHKITKAGKT